METHMEASELERLLRYSMPLTMASETAVRFTAERALDVIERDIPGVIVECGVWRGGSSIAMLLAQQERYGDVRKKVYMLDSFEGLPPVTARDGPLAAAWQSDTTSPIYYDNCRASLGELREALLMLGLPPQTWELVPGWFADSLPPLVERLRDDEIALLRLDGDWYDSTLICLEHLVPLVHEGGLVLIDDYYAWDGCACAVHDYLSRHGLAYRIQTMPEVVGAYFVKRAHRSNLDDVL
jgi:O-methyltransferase